MYTIYITYRICSYEPHILKHNIFIEKLYLFAVVTSQQIDPMSLRIFLKGFPFILIFTSYIVGVDLESRYCDYLENIYKYI